MSCIFHISFYILCLSNFPSWVLLWLLTQFIDTQIKPVVESTKQIMKISVNNYEWHELFPRGEFLFSPACCHYANLVKAFFFFNINCFKYLSSVKHNAGAILAVWAPIILVRVPFRTTIISSTKRFCCAGFF